MKPTITALALTTVSLLWGTAPAVAGDTKVARGTIASMAGHSMTVMVGDRDMTFRVDSNTFVQVRGGSTKTARAAARGKPGVHLDEVLTKGQPVAVTYKDIAGSLQATEIKAIAKAGAAKAAERRSDGVIKAIGGDWITINGKSGGGASFEQTLKIDAKTMVLAKGAGTAVAAKGGKAPFTDLVKSGDHVSVSYHEADGGLVASDVRVTNKAQ
jgi:uncharacterized protein DUF5666